MKNTPTQSSATAVEQENGTFNILDIFIVLAKYKRSIVYFPLVAAALGIAIAFAFTRQYRAVTTLLPPQQAQSGAGALLSQLGGVAAIAGGGVMKSPSDVYIGMLQSRTVADGVIKRLNLKEAYRTVSTEHARTQLTSRTKIGSGKDGIISIAVVDESPERSALLANAYVDELLKLTRSLALTEASQRRLFFERQLKLAHDNLVAAEVKLKNNLDSGGVVSIDGESRAIIATMGRLRAMISAKEIQLSSMSAVVTKSNPEYTRARQELISLQQELSRLGSGRTQPKNSVRPERSGLENVNSLRDLKYYQMLYELLAKQYEVARLDEAKESSSIQVLDVASPPERAASPKPFFVGLLIGFCSLLFVIGRAFFLEAKVNAQKNPETAAQMAQLRQYLRKP